MNKVVSASIRIIRSVERFADSVIRRTYPFTHHDSAGRAVFLDQAYDVRRTMAGDTLRRAPYGRAALPITLWKNFLELWLSVFLWMFAAAVERLVGMPFGLIIPVAVILYFSYQELYVDATKSRRVWSATLVDMVLWVIPSVWFIISVIM